MAFEATTWSPTDKGAAVSLSADKLTASYSAASGSNVRAAVGKTYGKWYWELTLVAASPGTTIIHTGVWPLSRPINTSIWESSGVFSLYQKFSQGDIWRFAFDADAGTLTVSKGATKYTTLTGLPVSPSEPWAPMVGDENGGAARSGQTSERRHSPSLRRPGTRPGMGSSRRKPSQARRRYSGRAR